MACLFLFICYFIIQHGYKEDGWQAFDDANGRGTWWWNKHTEEWFVESEPGDWTVTTDPRDNQTFWLHNDGRYFSASIEPWLINEQSDDSDKLLPADPAGQADGATQKLPPDAAV